MAVKHKCPVCSKHEFEYRNSMDYCDVCGWCDDIIQLENPNYEGGANKMSLNQAKEAYKNGEVIE